MAALGRTALIDAPAEQVFAYVDDIGNLARHRSESRAMPMMGSKLKLVIVSQNRPELVSRIAYCGRMMGLAIDYCEAAARCAVSKKSLAHHWRASASDHQAV